MLANIYFFILIFITFNPVAVWGLTCNQSILTFNRAHLCSVQHWLRNLIFIGEETVVDEIHRKDRGPDMTRELKVYNTP